MPAWKDVARAVAVLAVGSIVFASTVVQDTPRQTARDLQEISGNRISDGEIELCQYAAEFEEEALAKGRDQSVPGTTINVTDLNYGRMGNHFTSASRMLSMGYCCKAKLVTLPPKDPVLAPGMFRQGVPGPRHFDFSDAPDVPGFDYASECEAEYTLGAQGAYRAFLAMVPYHYGWQKNKELALCVRSVRVLDCEASYYFPKSLDLCGTLDASSGDLTTPGSTAESNVERAGNLVIHVRGGDIISGGNAHGSYGQPPLSYYVGVINNREWDRVDVVTHGAQEGDQNPVVPVLRMMAEMGTWPSIDFNIYNGRGMADDLQAMLCADALAASRSTVGEITLYHTRATTIFLPSTCEGYGSTFGHTSGRLIAARSSREEYFEVQGITLRPEAPSYTPYVSHSFTEIERLDMLQYSGIAGMEECTSSEQDLDRWDSTSSSRVPLGNVAP